MKIIQTKDLVIEQVNKPIEAWTVLTKQKESFYEPFSGTEIALNTHQYQLIDIEDNTHFSVIHAFRGYDTLEIAYLVARQYVRATDEYCVICPIDVPVDSHVIKDNGDIYCNEFIVRGYGHKKR